MTIRFVFLYQDGDTPLHKAVFANNVDVAQVLINAGAKMNIPNMVMIFFS